MMLRKLNGYWKIGNTTVMRIADKKYDFQISNKLVRFPEPLLVAFDRLYTEESSKDRICEQFINQK